MNTIQIIYSPGTWEHNFGPKSNKSVTQCHKIIFTSLSTWNHTDCINSLSHLRDIDWRSLQLRYLSLPINVIPVFLLHPHYTSCICVIFDLPYIIEIIWISSMTKALAIQATQPILGLRMRTKIIFINVVLIIYLCWIMW